MASVPALLTYADAIELLVEFSQGQDSEASKPLVRRCVQAAYEELATVFRWSFLERQGRVILNARQTGTGAVYDHTGSTYERELTLTGAGDTLPSWAKDGAIRLGSSDVVCDIQSVKDSTTATLNAQTNPGQDVASSSYVLYQRWVQLPDDFLAFTGPMAESSWQLGHPVTLTEMLALDRYNSAAGDLRYYHVAEVPDLYGQKALYFFPQPISTQTLDFVYTRQPRPLRYTGIDSACHQGTISVTAGSATVSGSGTAFDSGMIGSVLRIGTDATNPPNGRFGEYPWAEERAIHAVASATSLTLDVGVETTRSGVKCRISDPIDVGRIAHNAFLRLAEKHLAMAKNYKQAARIETAAYQALMQAKGADNNTYYDPLTDSPWPLSRIGTVSSE
jgi:hypothetical protein